MALHTDASSNNAPNSAEQIASQALDVSSLQQNSTQQSNQSQISQFKQLLNTDIRGKSITEQTKLLKELSKSIKTQTDIAKKSLEEQKAGRIEARKQYKEDSAEYKRITKEIEDIDNQEEALNVRSTAMLNVTKNIGGQIVSGLGSIADKMSGYFKEVISMNDAYRNQINTRLQGVTNQAGIWYNQADKWSKMQRDITTKFGMSMIVNEKDILTNINKAVSEGIANNVEQRALLATLSDNIANTFNAFSQEITRYIRLSQKDTTTLMLGMESSLNTMLNQWFSDTSYLTDVKTSSVSGQLFEAMSQMSAGAASEFNFTVQKWLGSLYSLGMSQEAISSIAGALGAAYSGNVNVNDTMQNLLAMSAARSGQSYADILKEGIDGSDVNKLLESMVGYLAEIAESPNNVVETAFGSVFGMTVSDLRAAANLARQSAAVSNQSTSIGTMLGQTEQMISTIGERLGMSGMLSNLKNNFLYTTAANLVGSGMGQFLYETITEFGNMIDTAIPGFSVLGTGVDFGGAHITDYINAAIGGLSIISGIGTAIQGIASGNAFANLNPRDWNTWNGQGTGFAGITSGGGKSLVAVGGAGGDIASTEISSAKSSAAKQQGYDEASTEPPDKDTDDIFAEIHTLAEYFFGENRKPILVDINPDTVPKLPVSLDDITVDMMGIFSTTGGL